jgi:signal transduction histidine kinase/CheY-like chemotaxis protein
MSKFISELCSTTFMPHGDCYLWNPALVWLNVISDGLITLAYFSIPITILYFIRRRADVPFPLIFLLFGMFIVACGSTHLMEVITVWSPHYWISGGTKAVTAGLSLLTACALVRVVPMALTLPSSAELKRLNESLEERVVARTAELTAVNSVLRREVGQREQAEAEVRRLNETLQRRLAELHALIDLLPVGIGIASDTECRIIQMNPGLSALLGASSDPGASLGAKAQEMPQGVRFEKGGRILAPSELPMQRAVAGNTPVLGFEQTVVRGDGTTLEILANAVPVRDPEGRANGCVGTFQDLTAQKQAERQRLLLERKLLETQKLESLGVLAGGIAHDFNNFLTGILGNASLAEAETPEGSPVGPLLDQIKTSSLRAADLCNQMLAYSGKGRFLVQKLDLNRLVRDSTHLLQISISKKAVVRFDFSPELAPIEADATQIRQVIMNLVINASEAIGDRNGLITVTTRPVRVDARVQGGSQLPLELPEGGYVALEISDTGSGMSPETQAKIFDPFFTTKFTGRGLGLAAVLGIVRGHKGALRVYSEVGRGSTFKILFPSVSGVADDDLGSPSDPGAKWKGAGRVLVVDDEETVRTTTAAMLRKMGFEVALATDGREAVSEFAANPNTFALVLLDLTMPNLDGEQTFAELRKLDPGVRVVLMSGFNQQDAISRFTGKGLASFVQKPFQFVGLRETLRRILPKPA